MTHRHRVNAELRALLGGFDFGIPYAMVSASDLATVEGAGEEYLRLQLADRNPPIPSPFATFPDGKVFIV